MHYKKTVLYNLSIVTKMVQNNLFPKELSHKGQVVEDCFSCSDVTTSLISKMLGNGCVQCKFPSLLSPFLSYITHFLH